MTAPTPEQELKLLKHENKRLKNLLDAVGLLCECCYTNSWTPTEHGERCECCWLHERWTDTKEQLEAVTSERDFLQNLVNVQKDKLEQMGYF